MIEIEAAAAFARCASGGSLHRAGIGGGDTVVLGATFAPAAFFARLEESEDRKVALSNCCLSGRGPRHHDGGGTRNDQIAPPYPASYYRFAVHHMLPKNRLSVLK